MEPTWRVPAPPPPPPLLLLLSLLLQVAGPVGCLAETLLDAPRVVDSSSSSPPSPASVVAPGTSLNEETRLPVFTLDYPHVQIPFEITLWILLASLAKIGEYARAPRAHPGKARTVGASLLGSCIGDPGGPELEELGKSPCRAGQGGPGRGR